MCGKKTSWQTKAAKSFDIYGCKIQNLPQCPWAQRGGMGAQFPGRQITVGAPNDSGM